MPPAIHRIRVWDLPTRLFHWLLAGCVLASVLSAKIGGNAMVWHFRLGYVVLALLLFRLVWGIVGGHWSRFARFIYSPAALKRQLSGRSLPSDLFHVGHSPTGALSVFALLAVLVVQVGTGLVADDEIANTGPLYKFVSEAASSQATHWHKAFGQWLIISLVVLHLAAIAFYVFKKHQNLVTPMLTGDKSLDGTIPATRDNIATRGIAVAIMAACAAAVAWLVSLGA